MQGRPIQQALDIKAAVELDRHYSRPQRPHGDSGQVNTKGCDPSGTAFVAVDEGLGLAAACRSRNVAVWPPASLQRFIRPPLSATTSQITRLSVANYCRMAVLS